MNDGKKYDKGKPRLSLLPENALMAVMESLEHGASKYGDENWRKVEGLQTRYLDSAFRHIMADRTGEQIDEDSDCWHLANAISSLLFKLEDRILVNQKSLLTKFPTVKLGGISKQE